MFTVFLINLRCEQQKKHHEDFLRNLEETSNLVRRWARNESRADNVISKNYH